MTTAKEPRRTEINESQMGCSYTHQNYRIDYVYGQTTVDQKRRIIDFWQRHRVLGNSQESVHRVHDVVFIAFDENDQVIGVSTAYIERDPQDNQRYFYYRMFIQPGNRESLLLTFLTGKTSQHLRDHSMPDKPLGLVIVAENPKLMRQGARRKLQQLGFTLSCHDDQGRDIWMNRW